MYWANAHTQDLDSKRGTENSCVMLGKLCSATWRRWREAAARWSFQRVLRGLVTLGAPLLSFPPFFPLASMSSWQVAGTIQYPSRHTDIPSHPPHPHINAIHFLFSHTLLVMVQWGNWFPLPAGLDGRACICITHPGMKMICAKLKWLGGRGGVSSGVSVAK